MFAMHGETKQLFVVYVESDSTVLAGPGLVQS
jgi:hypothetical protein